MTEEQFAMQPLTVAELRWSLKSTAEYLLRLKDRVPADIPEEVMHALGVASGSLARALAALPSATHQ